MRKVKKENFDKFMREHKLTKIAFCKSCNISVQTFNKLLNGANCNLIIVVKIAKFTGFKFNDMFELEEK